MDESTALREARVRRHAHRRKLVRRQVSLPRRKLRMRMRVFVAPAQAGAQFGFQISIDRTWIPAFAGMTSPLIPTFRMTSPLIPTLGMTSPLIPTLGMTSPLIPTFRMTPPLIPTRRDSLDFDPVFAG